VLENMVELVGLEPTTSSLRKKSSPTQPQYPCGFQEPFTFQNVPQNQVCRESCLTVFPAASHGDGRGASRGRRPGVPLRSAS